MMSNAKCTCDVPYSRMLSYAGDYGIDISSGIVQVIRSTHLPHTARSPVPSHTNHRPSERFYHSTTQAFVAK